MTNSPLVTYTQLSPNHSGLRKQKIDTITPHCVVGQASLQTLGNVFAPVARQASSNYGIDPQGRVGMYVEEKNRSWCTSSNANDQRAVTIEVASDTFHPYKVTDAAIQSLINLLADICIRNNIPKLLWKADKNLIGRPELQNITVHRWFANKACPGDYIYNRLGEIADEVNKVLSSQRPPTLPTPKPPVVPPQKPPEPIVFIPYLVKITTHTLYYRSGPGTNYPTNGVVHLNEVYTIVDESLGAGSSKWGKLKSGAGWIALDYCKKV